MKNQTSSGARPHLLRQTNAQLLLRLLREAGPCSKADLVRASSLSAPTVTNVVAHLAEAGLVEPVGEGDSTGGRPPDIIRFRAERGCIAAIEIGPTHLRFLLTDLDGRELGRAKSDLARQNSKPALVCNQIAKELRNLLRKQEHVEDSLLAVVVAVPAIVNVEQGIVVSLSKLIAWSNVPLLKLLKRELKCPVIVENDTNLAAQGEHFRGAAQRESNFVFITVGEGVGAGIFLDGNIYRGSQFSAGEIGYLRVPHVSREHPTIHGYGRLEKILGAPGILRSWHSAASRRSRPKVNHAVDVFDLAAAGNAQAKKILLQRAAILSDVILDLALILNPTVILLGGDVGTHPRLLQEVRSLLKGSEFAVVRVAPAALGSSATLWGAISVGMQFAVQSLF